MYGLKHIIASYISSTKMVQSFWLILKDKYKCLISSLRDKETRRNLSWIMWYHLLSERLIEEGINLKLIRQETLNHIDPRQMYHDCLSVNDACEVFIMILGVE